MSDAIEDLRIAVEVQGGDIIKIKRHVLVEALRIHDDKQRHSARVDYDLLQALTYIEDHIVLEN